MVGAALCCAAFAAPAAPAQGLGDALKKVFADAPKPKPRDERELGRVAAGEARGAPLTLDQAVARVRERHPKGEIVSATTRQTERGTLHVIKLLKANGKLKVIRIDAETGVGVD